MLVSRKICLLLHVGYTWALFGVTPFTNNFTFVAMDYWGKTVWVDGQNIKLEFKNSQSVVIRNYLWNRAKTIFITNEDSASKNQRHYIHFTTNAIYNEGLFVVRHEKKESPIYAAINGVRRPRFMKLGAWTSENRGTMIFASNAAKKLIQEFEIRLYYEFINLGAISILGSKDRAAVMCQSEMEKGAKLTNNGIIYFKHAIYKHLADLSGEGCLVVGHRGTFLTKSSYDIDRQRLHFLDGSGILKLVTNETPHNNWYYITNFPEGATILAAQPITYRKVEGSDFVFSNSFDSEIIIITFEGYTLDESKVVINRNLMRYAEDLVSNDPALPCAKMNLVMAEARRWEFES